MQVMNKNRTGQVKSPLHAMVPYVLDRCFDIASTFMSSQRPTVYVPPRIYRRYEFHSSTSLVVQWSRFPLVSRILFEKRGRPVCNFEFYLLGFVAEECLLIGILTFFPGVRFPAREQLLFCLTR